MGTHLHAHAFKRAQILLTRFFQSGLDIKTPKQIFESIYLFDARQGFLDLTNPDKRRSTDGLQALKRVFLTAAACADGHWQM